MKTLARLTAAGAFCVAMAGAAQARCEFDFTTANDAALAQSHWAGQTARLVGSYPFGSAQQDCERAASASAARLVRNGRPLPEGTELDIQCGRNRTTLGHVNRSGLLVLGPRFEAPGC